MRKKEVEARTAAHGPRCQCVECVRAAAVAKAAESQRRRVGRMLRKAGKPAWVDVHGVGMRRV